MATRDRRDCKVKNRLTEQVANADLDRTNRSAYMITYNVART